MAVIDIPFLCRGVFDQAPPRSLNPAELTQPLYTDRDGFSDHENVLQARRVPQSALTSPTLDLNGSEGATNKNNYQEPMVLESYWAGEGLLLVTTQEIWFKNASVGTWVNLTPVYTDNGTTPSTCGVTNGSKSVTGGVNTSWQTNNISPGNLFKASTGSWNIIDSVTGEGALTLVNNFDGSTNSADSYTIRRVFGAQPPYGAPDNLFPPIFAAIYNGDLFVAGMLNGRSWSSPWWADVPAIIKVTDIWNTGVSNADAEYIVAAETLNGTTQVLPELEQIMGMQFHDDGRVMIACWAKNDHYHTGTIDASTGSTTVTGHGTAWEDNDIQNGDTITIGGTDATVSSVTSNTELELTANAPNTVTDDTYMITRGGGRGTTIKNRFYYSSNLDHAEWLRSPAGFGDIPMVRGRMNAMGRLGRTVTFHFDRGIAVGTPSGQDDPPLNLQAVANADVGCVAPATLAQSPAGEIYLGSDGEINLFDGGSVRQLSSPVRGWLESKAPFFGSGLTAYSHAKFLSKRNIYRLYWPKPDLSTTLAELTYDLERARWSGKVWDDHEMLPITAQTDETSLLYTSGTQLYFGVPSYWGNPEANLEMLYLEGARLPTGGAVNGRTLTHENSATTDWFDAGAPNVLKSWHTVYLWKQGGFGSSHTVTVTLEVAATGTGTSSEAVSVTTGSNHGILQFSFQPKAGDAARITIAYEPPNTDPIELVRAQVEFEPLGPVPHGGGAENA